MAPSKRRTTFQKVVVVLAIGLVATYGLWLVFLMVGQAFE